MHTNKNLKSRQPNDLHLFTAHFLKSVSPKQLTIKMSSFENNTVANFINPYKEKKTKNDAMCNKTWLTM